MIAVTFALPEESQDFVKLLKDARALEKGRLPAWRGTVGGKDVTVWHTGVGGERSRARVAGLLDREQVEYVISAGFAGGLDPRLAPGAVLVAENFSAAPLLEIARRVTGERAYGSLSTQQHTVESVEAKRALFEQTGAAGVDMETETIFRVCTERGIPMLAVRGISDAAGEPLQVPYAVWFNAETQSPRVMSLLLFLLTHPARLAPFARFVGNIGHARRALTAFLDAFVRAD